MTETISTILSRRSVRRFEARQISDEQLSAILLSALYAPTGGNSQCSRFIVIQQPELLERLNRVYVNELASRELIEGQTMNVGIKAARNEGCNFFYHAPTLISAAAPRDYSNSMASCAAGLENIQLAAFSMGLGACWGNQGHWLTDVPAVREIFEALGMTEDEDIFGSVCIGYPAYISSRERPRKPGRIILDSPRDIPGL